MVDIASFVDGIVHEPTQTEGTGFDLTVANVYEVTEPGRVDFGGGELDAADLSEHDSSKRNPDDDYEWWHLDAGTYLLEYNEQLELPDDVLATVQTRDDVRARGAYHPTVRTREVGRLPLTVAGAGIKIKENARVSTVVDVTRK